MNPQRKRTSNRGFQLTAKAAAYLEENRPVQFQLTAKGKAFIEDCKAKLAESQNVAAPRKIDAIIAEIRAPKAAPTECPYCRCTSIDVYNVGKRPPAYVCALCDAWIRDVNPVIDLKSELIRKYEDLIWKLNRIPLSNDSAFEETLELVQAIRLEILSIEGQG